MSITITDDKAAERRYPYEYLWESDEFCAYDFEELDLEFRLIYQGPLPSSNTKNRRAKFKQNLREHFHGQLAHLWSVQQPLEGISKYRHVSEDMSTVPPTRKEWTRLDTLADMYKDKHGIRWAPLVNRQFGLACELDILFLRRANPGNITTHGGEIGRAHV